MLSEPTIILVTGIANCFTFHSAQNELKFIKCACSVAILLVQHVFTYQ